MNEGASQRRSDLVPLDEERDVIHRLQRGDHSAVATLLTWYGDALYRSAILPRVPNRELAEDCLRDTYRTAIEKIASFQLTDRSIFFWLRRIAINKAIDVHRRHRRDQDLASAVRAEPSQVRSSVPPRPDRGIEIEDTRKLVELSLSRLNPRYATALRMRLIEERDRSECAEILGVKLGTFDVLLHRAAKAFRKVYPP